MTQETLDLLERLPSRMIGTDPAHPVHQLVIEKFPNKTWSVSYVCLTCKGKTIQYNEPSLETCLADMVEWVEDVVAHHGLKEMHNF